MYEEEVKMNALINALWAVLEPKVVEVVKENLPDQPVTIGDYEDEINDMIADFINSNVVVNIDC